MKRIMPLVLGALLFCSFRFVAAQTFVWTGVGNGWKNQIAPTGLGGEDLVFVHALGQNIVLPGNTYNSLTFINDNDFYLSLASSLPLTLSNGISFTSSYPGRAIFNSNNPLRLAQAQVWDAGVSNIVVSGKITGTGPLTLRATANGNGTGLFIFNSPSPVNDYTGGTVIDMVGPNSGAGVSFWNSTPFGSGAVTITNGAFLIAHNSNTLANNFTLTSSSANPLSLRSWDAPLTLSGSITLASNAFIAPRHAFTSLPAPSNQGADVMPGPVTRFPTVITGNVGESSLGRSLTVGGAAGVLILNPTTGLNTYTGGTTVSGSLIFGNNNALPATGVIQVGAANTNFAFGYAGTGNVSSGNFALFLGKLSPTSSGAVGVDTLPGASAPVTMSDPINLTGFTTTAVNGLRLGTATSAILTGAITPQGNNYHFGNGGGSLFVQSNLGATTGGSIGTQVITDNYNQGPLVPLKLYLQGTNTYAGGTVANNGFIIFDGLSAIPGSGSLTASGNSSFNFVGASYIGYTDRAGIAGSAIGTNISTFLGKFNKPGTWGIIGIDTSPAAAAPVDIPNLSLTGFNNGVLVGTTSSAILSGTITVTDVANATNPGNTLRLTAAEGGTLTVNSNLTGTIGVELGTNNFSPGFSSGTVVLNGANSHSGGTRLDTYGGLTLAVGNAAALGTGPLTVAVNNGAWISVVGLKANTASLVIPNNLVFQTPDYTNNFPAELALVGANNFTLAGNISSGPSPLSGSAAVISLYNATPINVTLSGDNSGYFGDLDVVNGTLTLANNTAGVNHAAGRGTLLFDSPGANVVFTGGAATELLYGIKGAAGSLVLPTGTNLTIDNSAYQNGSFNFGGVISEAGPLASLTVTSTTTNSDLLYLYGHNTYTGGTNITGYGVLGLGASDSAGSGLITINATQGGLALNTGVTLANPIQFTSGGLAGLGTFAPSSVNGVAGGTITFGANQIVFPGLPSNSKVPGQLTLATNVAFATGGDYKWTLQDPASLEGYGQLVITGNLDLISISTAGFLLSLESLDSNGLTGFDPLLVSGTNYTFRIVTAGSITLFDPTKFAFDVTKFQNGLIPSSAFSVTSDSTHLYLNFTAVPEPSTWMLLGAGASMLGLAALQRRRIPAGPLRDC